MFPSYALSSTLVAGPTARRAGERCDSAPLLRRGGAVQERRQTETDVLGDAVHRGDLQLGEFPQLLDQVLHQLLGRRSPGGDADAPARWPSLSTRRSMGLCVSNSQFSRENSPHLCGVSPMWTT